MRELCFLSNSLSRINYFVLRVIVIPSTRVIANAHAAVTVKSTTTINKSSCSLAPYARCCNAISEQELWLMPFRVCRATSSPGIDLIGINHLRRHFYCQPWRHQSACVTTEYDGEYSRTQRCLICEIDIKIGFFFLLFSKKQTARKLINAIGNVTSAGCWRCC